MTAARPNPFVALKPGTVTPLPADDHFAAADHLWAAPEIQALTLALSARRPLLVRGEAGSGKSQLARAAAAVLDSGPPLAEVIDPRYEARDLLYSFDAVARLSDAQLRDKDGRPLIDLSNERYVTQGVLWQAFERAARQPVPPVLLIDEIDKADADLPNALLDVLGNRSFAVPPLQGRRVHLNDAQMPLIVITTNEERELPAAFVRRCVVLNLNPPADEAPFVAWLRERAAAHTGLAGIGSRVSAQAAAQVWVDRQAAARAGYPEVGLAEYIDLLTALAELTLAEPPAQRTRRQLRWLAELSAYALVKHASQDQRRPALASRPASAD